MEQSFNLEVITINILTEPQYDFVKQYINLLDTVQDGIELVDVSYQDRNFGSGDQLLKDLIGAFIPFNASNYTMQSIFFHDKCLTDQLQKFHLILDQVQHLSTLLPDEKEKISFLHDFLLPAYTQWKTETYNLLKGYIEN